MKTVTININHRQCLIYRSQAQPEALLIQPVHVKELPRFNTLIDLIAADGNRPFALAAFTVDEWTRQLMPWHDPDVDRDPNSGAHAHDTLHFITQFLLPYCRQLMEPLPVIIGGYSLAALFALWATTLTDVFHAVAAASPSVWIRGWNDFASTHSFNTQYVYLSLGDREHITKNQAIARVADNLRALHRHLALSIGTNHVTLEWNNGGHFTDETARTARAFATSLLHCPPSRF